MVHELVHESLRFVLCCGAGTLPSSLGSMSAVSNFYVNSNSFSGNCIEATFNTKIKFTCIGTIPSSFGGMSKMQQFVINNNVFKGNSLLVRFGVCLLANV